MEKLAQELLARETLTGDEIREIVLGKKSDSVAVKKNGRKKSNAKK